MTGSRSGGRYPDRREQAPRELRRGGATEVGNWGQEGRGDGGGSQKAGSGTKGCRGDGGWVGETEIWHREVGVLGWGSGEEEWRLRGRGAARGRWRPGGGDCGRGRRGQTPPPGTQEKFEPWLSGQRPREPVSGTRDRDPELSVVAGRAQARPPNPDTTL